MMVLDNKNALVTASSKGIGFAVAKGLLQAGARVALCARNEDALKAAVTTLSVYGKERLFALAGDIGNQSFPAQFITAATKSFGADIDILVNNNGGPPAGDTLSKDDTAWERAIAVNLMSVIRFSRLVIPGMQKKKWGRIINLTSTTAKEPDPGMVLSNVTRAGVAAYGKTLSREFGPFGITVNTVLTGGVLTDRLRGLIEGDIQGTSKTLAKATEEIAASIPVGYIATPDEFAQTILFLASPQSGYLNGASIPLDGGYMKGI